jgi:SAM-dependent methyltransferase
MPCRHKLAHVSFEPDFGRTADDYARHRAGFPIELVDRLGALGIVRPGQRVVDLGTGTGSLGRLFAERGCAVTGVDISAPLIEQARLLDREAGLETRYVNAPAEGTGLPSSSFDLVSAGQCWHWFDRPAAAGEAKRLLGDEGAIAIAHLDRLPLDDNIVAATERLILRYNPSWPFAAGTGIYPQWLTDLREGGFTDVETLSFDVSVPYSHEDWVGRVRASAPIAGTLEPDRVQRFSTELGMTLAERFPEEPLAVPHRVWAATGRATAPTSRRGRSRR